MKGQEPPIFVFLECSNSNKTRGLQVASQETDPNSRKKKTTDRRDQKAQRNAGVIPAEWVRYRERSTMERAFGRLQDEFGGRNIWVRGHEKVSCHLMLSVVVLTVDQWLRMVQ